MERDQLCLADAPIGAELTLALCLAEPWLRSRLATLGLRCGAPIQVIRKTGGGGRIIGVAGARIALDRSVVASLYAKTPAGAAA